MRMTGIIKRTLSMFLTVLVIQSGIQVVIAQENANEVKGTVYEFGAKDHYDFSSSKAGGATELQSLGRLVVSGNLSEEGSDNGFQTYNVASGNLAMNYSYDPSVLSDKDTDWHLIEDKSKTVDGYKLEKSILDGAVIVQSSKDGKTWITDAEFVDVFKSADALPNSIYTTKDVQLENGCFYRVIVVYELQRKIGEKKVALLTTDITEEKKVAEVYSFYAVNAKKNANVSSASNEPRKEIASSPVKTEKDKGFSGEKVIDKDDPHFGWNLGTFVINGYTRETMYEGRNYYLKNAGDKVTLWFTLNQDITKLNGNSNYSIADDKKAYDRDFGIEETNFGHGTLIISYTDYQGRTHDPIIYTDFLAANATTGADTKVQLFEEGDYEVALDYEIKNTPRKVGSVEVVPEYSDYKIEFGFSIRNGNCMVYPFDITTGNELSDNAVTENGFKVDMAKSRYLVVDVEKTVLKDGEDGILKEDVRFNRPAKDNEVYDGEGIYTFTVKNLYTGSTTTKTLYVGENPYYRALSKNNFSVDELNAKIEEGWSVEMDGSLVPKGRAIEGNNKGDVQSETEDQEPEILQTQTENVNDMHENGLEGDQKKADEIELANNETTDSGSSFPYVLIGLFTAGCVAIVGAKWKKGGAK